MFKKFISGTLFLLGFISGIRAEECQVYLDNADKYRLEFEDLSFTVSSKVTALSNLSLMYMKRYEICMNKQTKKNEK